MLEPIQMGTKMAAGNQQKHLSLSVATKAEIYLSRNSKTLLNTLSNTRTVQIAKFPKISHFLNQYDNSFDRQKCHVTQKRDVKRGLSQNQEPFGAKICMHTSFQLLFNIMNVTP